MKCVNVKGSIDVVIIHSAWMSAVLIIPTVGKTGGKTQKAGNSYTTAEYTSDPVTHYAGYSGSRLMGQCHPIGTHFKNTFKSVWNVWNWFLLMQQCLEPRNVIKQGIWGHQIKGYWSCPTSVDCPIHLISTVVHLNLTIDQQCYWQPSYISCMPEIDRHSLSPAGLHLLTISASGPPFFLSFSLQTCK